MSSKKIILLGSLVITIALLAGCTPKEYELEVQAYPEDAGKIKGEGIYEEGEEVKLEAEPEEGYKFEKWKKEGKKKSKSKIYEVIIDGDINLTATFERIIPDDSLNEAIKKELGTQEPLTKTDMEQLTVLKVPDEGIQDIKGLEYASNIKRLNLKNNEIKNPEVILELKKLEKLEICLNSIDSVQQEKFVTNLPNLEQFELEGMERFHGLEDLKFEGSSKIFEKGEDGLDDIFEEPEDVDFEGEVFYDVVGPFNEKTYRYPQFKVMFQQNLAVYEPQTQKWVVDEEEGADFHFKILEVFALGVKGPREIEVGDSLEDIMEKFPILYQDDEVIRRNSEVKLDNGSSIEKIVFEDHLLDEDPFGLSQHHFTFTLSFKENEVNSFEIKRILYDL